MTISLEKLFSLIDTAPGISVVSEDLFELTEKAPSAYQFNIEDIDFLLAYFYGRVSASNLDGNARLLFDLSPGAFDTLLHAWMSELPIEKEMAVFGCKILAAPSNQTAHQAANDRGDVNTLTVLNSAGKVYHEVHRMMGLLRFIPDENGIFIAKCAPDHFILPALALYFTARFCETSWSIIDEKRGLTLSRLPQKEAEITKTEDIEPASSSKNDEWEELWKHYHKTINNEDRNNPNLQRQLMPQRYWKYLSEIRNNE